MTSAANPRPSRIKVREHRARLRDQGLRPIQIWVPDVRSPAFRSERSPKPRSVCALAGWTMKISCVSIRRCSYSSDGVSPRARQKS